MTASLPSLTQSRGTKAPYTRQAGLLCMGQRMQSGICLAHLEKSATADMRFTMPDVTGYPWPKVVSSLALPV